VAQSLVRGHWIAPLLGRALRQRPIGQIPMTKWIARQAEIHGVPEAWSIVSSSAKAVISQASSIAIALALCRSNMRRAREMGYKGDAKGLLDPKINLTYAVPYLANALSSRRRR